MISIRLLYSSPDRAHMSFARTSGLNGESVKGLGSSEGGGRVIGRAWASIAWHFSHSYACRFQQPSRAHRQYAHKVAGALAYRYNVERIAEGHLAARSTTTSKKRTRQTTSLLRQTFRFVLFVRQLSTATSPNRAREAEN